MAKIHVSTLLLAILLYGCDPVTPVAPISTTEFEGFTVRSYVPAHPVGIVYLFHGSGGSADIGLRIEMLDQTNELVARGYGWVATESTQRTGNKRWDVFDSSISTNPDLARLVRLQQHLVATTGVANQTPIFGIGMSNGARMVTLFAAAFTDNGYPVAAVAPYNGRAAPSVQATGGLTVPGFWLTSANDTVVLPASVIADQQASATLGTTTMITTKQEEPLLPYRFTRIPSIDAEEAEIITEALRNTGAWDAQGNRILDIASTLSLVDQLVVQPGFGAARAEVRNQVEAMMAVHQFVGLYREVLVDFFDAQLAP